MHAGNLVAFDKHLNLVLRDVEERYTVLLRVQKAKTGEQAAHPCTKRHQTRSHTAGLGKQVVRPSRYMLDAIVWSIQGPACASAVTCSVSRYCQSFLSA